MTKSHRTVKKSHRGYPLNSSEGRALGTFNFRGSSTDEIRHRNMTTPKGPIFAGREAKWTGYSSVVQACLVFCEGREKTVDGDGLRLRHLVSAYTITDVASLSTCRLNGAGMTRIITEYDRSSVCIQLSEEY